MRALSALRLLRDDAVELRVAGREVTNSRTRSLALVSSSTPRKPSRCAVIELVSDSNSESTAARHSSSFDR